MEKKRDIRNVMMIALVVAIMVMAVGYATLSQRLTVNGKATIDASWKVRITSIEFDETASSLTSTTADETHGFNPAEAVTGEGSTGVEFDVTLGQPGDKAVYNITVTNLGTIEAKLNAIVEDLTTVNAAAPEDIKFTIESAPTIGDSIATNATHDYVVSVEWVKTAGEQTVPETVDGVKPSKTATIHFDYEQA